MLRRSFLPSIPEHELAADLLSRAADAFVAADFVRCAALVRAADFDALAEFAHRVTGAIDPAIHRQTSKPSYLPRPGGAGPRMPGAGLTRHVFERDGWRCRFCGVKVIAKEARNIFRETLPAEARWGRVNAQKHAGLAALTASIDHLTPFRRGGTNDVANLVAACGPCQFGRNVWLLEEVEIESPLAYPAIVDAWDGLTRVLPARPRRTPG